MTLRGRSLAAIVAATVLASLAGCGTASIPSASRHFSPSPLPPWPGNPTCALPSANPTPPAQNGLLLGVHASLRFANGAYFCRLLGAVRASGARILREDFEWADIEPANGVFRWARWDAIVGYAAREGLTVLPVLDMTPAWAGHPMTALPSNQRAFAKFVAATVRRYGPGGTFWRSHPTYASYAPTYFEIWNEPYMPKYSGGQPNPARYARLYAAAVRRGRAANPKARFLLEGETTYSAGKRSGLSWMDGMFGAVKNLGEYVDGVAVHPYSDYPPGDQNPRIGLRFRTDRVAAIWQFLSQHHVPRPIWITEIGWSTCRGVPHCVSTAQQASDMASMLTLVRTQWHYVHALIVFTLQDSPLGTTGASLERFFGLLNAAGRPKPAWFVFHRVADGAR